MQLTDRTQCFEFSPNERIKADGWWLMKIINVTKCYKLITVQTYNSKADTQRI